MPKRRAVLMTRQAISPRLAIRIRLNMPRWTPQARHLGFAAEQRKCQLLLQAAAGFQTLNEASRPTAGTDVAGDPRENVGVDIRRTSDTGPRHLLPPGPVPTSPRAA